MIAGLGVTIYYMVQNEPWMRSLFGVVSPPALWFGISPISAGIFGMCVGAAVLVVVSLLTPRPRAESRAFTRGLRFPGTD
jgi:cation/acetate symporter